MPEQKSAPPRGSEKKKKSMLGKIALLLLALFLVGAGITVLIGARGIHLRSATVVNLSPEESWSFFQNPHNLAEWDRSVARVEPTSSGEVGLGYTFDTIAPPQPGQKEGMRMSYRVTKFVSPQRAEISLVNSPMFQEAVWAMIVEPVSEGTRIISEVRFVPKLQYSFLVPVLLFTSKDALGTDMKYLKACMEAASEDKDPSPGSQR